MAFAVWARSTKTTPAALKSGPKMGFDRISFFATPVRSRRRSFNINIASRPLWWLKMKTAGRCDQRCCSPSTRRSIPASEVARSLHTAPITLVASRWERLTRPAAAPAHTEGARLA
jgi:hypothetical protein